MTGTYRVLVAQDDQCGGVSPLPVLERCFPQEMELLSAGTGPEALALCQAGPIDIAFIDLPGLIGIETIRDIKDILPSILIVFITARDCFDYERLVNGLDAYARLSRPPLEEWIEDAGRNAMAAVDLGRRKQYAEIRMRGKLDSVLNIVESDFIYALISPSEKNSDIETYLDFFAIKGTSYFFMIIELPATADSAKAAVYGAVRDIVAGAVNSVVGPRMRNQVVVFIPRETGPSPEDQTEIKKLIKTLHSRMAARTGLRIKIGVSGIGSDLSQSLIAYGDSVKALSVCDDKGGVVHYADVPGLLEGIGMYPVETERKLLERVGVGDLSGTHAHFLSVALWLSRHCSGDTDALKYKLFELLVLARLQAQKFQPAFGGFPAWKETWKRIVSLDDAESLEKYVLSGIDECVGVIAEHRQSRMSPLIIKACTIIHENLSRELSLEDLSGRVAISPFYFSKLFKEETGENFIDYITMARMQKAKELLRDPSLSVRQICGEAGYADPNYFSKLFKKIVGLTPTEFRASL